MKSFISKIVCSTLFLFVSRGRVLRKTGTAECVRDSLTRPSNDILHEITEPVSILDRLAVARSFFIAEDG